MYTLVYLNGNLNRPDTLLSFLQSNVGKSPLLQIDCITPFKGSREELTHVVCNHLNQIDPQIQVSYCVTNESESKTRNTNREINYHVIQIQVNQRN